MNRHAGLAGVLAAGLLVLAFAGCSKRPDYQDTALSDVLAHRVPAPLERYLIDRPPVPAVRRNTGIIRDGSLFAILVGPDLKKNLEAFPANARFGVRLVREPSVYLILERVYVGEEFTDLLGKDESFRFHFPKFVPPAEVPFDDFRADLPESLAARTGNAQLSDVPLTVSNLTEAEAAWAGPLSPGMHVDHECYAIGPPECRFLVGTRDPMVLLMLDFLRTEKRAFSGGVTLVSSASKAERARVGLAGIVDVKWIHLGGSMYFMAP